MASASGGGNTTGYGYDPAGDLITTTLPAGNGYSETRSYDNAGRLIGVKNANATSTLSDYQATLDPVGNPTEIDQTGAVSLATTYSYDNSDRLTGVCYQASCPNNGDPYIRWTYDKVGNRLTETRPGGATTYTYNNADELTQAGVTNYGYDNNGNQTTAGTTSYSYDLANRLTSVNDGATNTSYSYDGDGNRLTASTGPGDSQTTNYQWDTNNTVPEIALEQDGNGALLRRYSYGAGDGPTALFTGGASFYYHRDTLGNIVNVTSSGGATEWSYGYEPFGVARVTVQNDPNAPANPIEFSGQYLDPTGLYYMKARQYDPGSGRFTSVDPLRATEDRFVDAAYVYANDTPTRYFDPSGAGPIAVSRYFASAISEVVSTANTDMVLPGDGGGPFAHYYPFDRQMIIGRVDAGVDTATRHVGPVFAIGAGQVEEYEAPRPGGPWVGWGVIYLRLSSPITIHGRHYKHWYSAETDYYAPTLRRRGATVTAGQVVAITKSGWQETGFFAGQDLNGDKKSREGYDFRDFCDLMRKLGHFAPGA